MNRKMMTLAAVLFGIGCSHAKAKPEAPHTAATTQQAAAKNATAKPAPAQKAQPQKK